MKTLDFKTIDGRLLAAVPLSDIQSVSRSYGKDDVCIMRVKGNDYFVVGSFLEVINRIVEAAQ